MPVTPVLMRLLILLCALGMVLMAAFYLRGRRLPLAGYLGWGLLALLLPFLGPFLVILSQPGVPLNHRPRRRSACRLNPVLPALNRARAGLRKLLQQP
jgi:hypothetical protein